MQGEAEVHVDDNADISARASQTLVRVEQPLRTSKLLSLHHGAEFSRLERDVAGVCESSYSVEHHGDDAVRVTRTRDHASCSGYGAAELRVAGHAVHTESYRGYTQHEWATLARDSGVQKPDHVTSLVRTTHTLSRSSGVLTSVQVEEDHRFHMSGENKHGAHTVSNGRLTLTDTRPARANHKAPQGVAAALAQVCVLYPLYRVQCFSTANCHYSPL